MAFLQPANNTLHFNKIIIYYVAYFSFNVAFSPYLFYVAAYIILWL